MKRLIVNADDFGLHPSINAGILDGYKNGIITSTSIMPTGLAFEGAVSIAEKNKKLGIGVHLTLVGEHPCANIDLIPSLVDNNGLLPKHYPYFLLNFLSGKIDKLDIQKELFAQVKKVVESGLSITHLDSHQHMHVVPGVIDIVIALAKKFNIHSIRIPAEPYLFLGNYPAGFTRILARGGLTFLAEKARKKVERAGLSTTHHFFGMLAGGNMQEVYLKEILTRLPQGTSEIMMHPGGNNRKLADCYSWQYQWEYELAALKSSHIKNMILSKNINLISFEHLNEYI